MRSSWLLLEWLLLPSCILAISHLSTAYDSMPTAQALPHGLQRLLNDSLSAWRQHQHQQDSLLRGPNSGYRAVVAMGLSFLAAAISSAGGVGGGPLFLPILNLVSGLDLKAATSYSAFMVTGVLLSNVIYNLFFTRLRDVVINYDIALLSEPCMLLGVSLGVICNIAFPEWLITALFAIFLASSTYKTCRAGMKCWKRETEAANRYEARRLERGAGTVEPLLGGRNNGGGGGSEGDVTGIHYKDMVVLVMVWVSFLLLHVLIGDEQGKGALDIKPCGVAYWLVTLTQVPFAIAFTVYILYQKRNSRTKIAESNSQDDAAKSMVEALPMSVFPFAALLTGVLSGLFGIGGGLILNPLLLHIGIPPPIAAATGTFMLLFPASMSMAQYIILGVTDVKKASVYAAVCFGASVLGLVIIQRAIRKSGRVSLIIFAVTTVMALSTIVITCSGAVDVWGQYISGKYMGFRPPC